MLRLVSSAADGGSSYAVRLQPGLTRIGRDPPEETGLHQARLPAAVARRLSRRHAIVTLLPGGGVLIADTSGDGPAHGVFVNGVMLARGAECAVRDADVVSLGPPGSAAAVRLQLHAAPPPPGAPPPEADSPTAAPDGGALLRALREQLRCSVCLDTVAHAVAPTCGHAACAQCILNWIYRSSGEDGDPLVRRRCPTCAGPAASLMRRRDTDAIVEACVLPHESPEERAAHARRAAAGAAGMRDTALECGPPAAEMARRMDELQAAVDAGSARNAAIMHYAVAQLGNIRELVGRAPPPAPAPPVAEAPPPVTTRKRRAPNRLGFDDPGVGGSRDAAGRF